MTRSQLKNTFNRTRNTEDFANYKKQRNFVVNFKKQARRTCFNNVETDTTNSNKACWKACKPFFSNKCFSNEIIFLIEDETIMQDEVMVAEIFNNYFITITKYTRYYKVET